MLENGKKSLALRFSLRHLMLGVTVVCAIVALITWQGVLGALLAWFLASLVLIVAGIVKRRKAFLWAGAVMALIGGVFGTLQSLTVCHWTGWRMLNVDVRVIDTDTLEPVPHARIEVLNGPLSLVEGPVYPDMLSQFSPATAEPGFEKLTTDKMGQCSFTHRFFAAGADGFFRDTGYIRLGGTWLRVSGKGRGSVLLPIDGQSFRPPDLQDTTPVSVTVPLRKQPDP